MNRTNHLLGSLAALIAASCVHAAEPKKAVRVPSNPDGEIARVGRGILICDIEKAKKAQP